MNSTGRKLSEHAARRGALLVLCVIVSLGIAQAQTTELSARYSVNGAEVRCDPKGSVQIWSGEDALVSGTHMVIAAPGWSSSVSQSQVEPEAEYPRRDGDALVWRGTIPDPKSNVVWTFEERIEPGDSSVLLSYAITPSADVQVGEAVVFFDLPGAHWQDKSILLLPTMAGTFPVRQGGPRHFLSGTALNAVLGDPEVGQLSFEFKRPSQCTVQDVRAEDRDMFQLYPRISQSAKLLAGREYRLDITLTPNDRRQHGLPVTKVSSEGEPGITSALLSAGTVPRFGLAELTCEVTGTWKNPFDPEQVTLDAEITDPSGKTVTVPGFYWLDYEALADSGDAALIPAGEPKWKVRYTPVLSGTHRMTPVLRNAGRTIRHEPVEVVCTGDAAGHGFVRVSDTNPHYFEYDDGTPFFAVGENVALIHGDGLEATAGVYEKLAGAGGNLIRSWWCYSTTDLQSWQTGRDGEGFGMMKLENAWRIDRLISEAERLGIHIMCCLETQQNLRRDQTWGRFTYNEANGGPASRPREFFTNPQSQKAFRARLRYIVARWGYSPAVFSWQFWNEVSACNEFEVEPVALWHQDMARYLRSIDPWKHLVHTNFGNMDGYREVDGLPEMDVVSTNIYCRRDMGQTAYWAGREMARDYNKPFLLTEYGVGHYGKWVREDPDGVIVHNGLWGSVVSGAAGSALPWGCYDWIDTQDFYHYWRPVSAVVKDVPFHERTWQPVNVGSFVFADGGAKSHYSGVFFEGWPRNYSYTTCGPAPEVYEVSESGEPSDQASLRGMLGAGQEQRFKLDCPADGDLVVHVPEISADGPPVLEIAIDGATVLTQPLPPAEEDHWAYWRFWSVPITRGEHQVSVRNAGKGTLWTGFELTRFRHREGPDLDVYGTQCEDFILLWLRDPQFIWIYQREGRTTSPQPEGVLTLTGVADGAYRVWWVDTVTGQELGETRLNAAGGRLVLQTPPVNRSAAARIEKTD